MDLIDEIEKRIWERFVSYRKVQFYIEKFQVVTWYGEYDSDVNFKIYKKQDKKIDLQKTLHYMDEDTLLKIAIDLGIETPDFIPAFPKFKNVAKENKNLKRILDIAFKNVSEDPALSIANSYAALESLCKSILKKHSPVYNEKHTLPKLVAEVLKLFGQYPEAKQTPEVRTIGSSLIKIAHAIEDIRSRATPAHGKDGEADMIDEPIYAYFIINAVATVALYIDNFYKKKILKDEAESFVAGTNETEEYDDLPF